MKKLVYKILTIPLLAFFVNMFTVAILGSFMSISELKELLGGTNTMPIWLAWIGIFFVTTIVHHFLKKEKD